MSAAHRRTAIVAALFGCVGCTSVRTLGTAPAPGMRVQVDFAQRRNVDVLVRDGRDSVPFDSVGIVRGKVVRTSGDTVWLVDVYVDSAGKQLRAGPDARLRVSGVGREAEVREVRFSTVDTTAAIVGSAVGIAALILVLIMVVPRTGDT